MAIELTPALYERYQRERAAGNTMTIRAWLAQQETARAPSPRAASLSQAARATNRARPTTPANPGLSTAGAGALTNAAGARPDPTKPKPGQTDPFEPVKPGGDTGTRPPQFAVDPVAPTKPIGGTLDPVGPLDKKKPKKPPQETDRTNTNTNNKMGGVAEPQRPLAEVNAERTAAGEKPLTQAEYNTRISNERAGAQASAGNTLSDNSGAQPLLPNPPPASGTVTPAPASAGNDAQTATLQAVEARARLWNTRMAEMEQAVLDGTVSHADFMRENQRFEAFMTAAEGGDFTTAMAAENPWDAPVGAAAAPPRRDLAAINEERRMAGLRPIAEATYEAMPERGAQQAGYNYSQGGAQFGTAGATMLSGEYANERGAAMASAPRMSQIISAARGDPGEIQRRMQQMGGTAIIDDVSGMTPEQLAGNRYGQQMQQWAATSGVQARNAGQTAPGPATAPQAPGPSNTGTPNNTGNQNKTAGGMQAAALPPDPALPASTGPTGDIGDPIARSQAAAGVQPIPMARRPGNAITPVVKPPTTGGMIGGAGTSPIAGPKPNPGQTDPMQPVKPAKPPDIGGPVSGAGFGGTIDPPEPGKPIYKPADRSASSASYMAMRNANSPSQPPYEEGGDKGRLGDMARGAGRGIENAAGALGNAIAHPVTAVQNMGRGLGTQVGNVGRNIGNVIQNPIQSVQNAGRNIGEGIGNVASGVGNAIGNVAGGIGNVAGGIADRLRGMFGTPGGPGGGMPEPARLVDPAGGAANMRPGDTMPGTGGAPARAAPARNRPAGAVGGTTVAGGVPNPGNPGGGGLSVGQQAGFEAARINQNQEQGQAQARNYIRDFRGMR